MSALMKTRPLQCASLRLEGARIEEVEEVGHHEDGEEQGQLIGCDGGVRSQL